MRKRLTAMKLARLQMGLSQYDVEVSTGIRQVYISLYERKLKEPKAEHKEILAKLYGRKVRDFWK
jgi:transcriptional regulator with XRE-family HTH domain